MTAPKLDSIRSQIAHRRTEIEFVASAPRTVDEGVATILHHFDEIAESSAGALRLGDALSAHDDVARFSFGSPYSPDPQGDRELVLLLLGRKHVETQARAALTARAANQPAGLSADERRKRVASLKAEIEKLEIDEEKLILQLEGANGFIARRHDSDARIILKTWQENLPEKIA